MQHLLEHFKALTLHPKNAQELKGLILQLAVQGKLTAQWRRDNPDVELAEILFERIQKEKSRLIKLNEIPKEKAFPKIDVEQVRYKIPSTWLWCNLGQTLVLNSGRDLTPNEYSENQLTYPYLTGASQIKKGKIILDRWTDTPKVLSFKEDVLISVKGTIGKTIINEVGEIHIARQIMALRSHGWYEHHYLKLFADSYLKNLQDVSNGIIPGISREHLLYAEFPLPPLEEQKAIVATVNQLFAEVELLEAATKKRIQLKEDFVSSALRRLSTEDTASAWGYLQPHFKTFFTEKSSIKKLRESILQLAVQGKLTRDFRKSHPELCEGTHSAEALLERIKAEKAKLIKDGKIKKEKPLLAITADEIPYKLPVGWVWCRLGESLLYSDAGKSPDCEKRPVEGQEWGVLTTTAIQQNRFDQQANKILPRNFEINPQQIVEQGDILLTRAGPINRTGIACKVDAIQYNLILSDKTIRLKYIEGSLFPDYIVLTLNSSQIRELLLGKMIGMASSQVNISQSNIRGVCFPMPPFEEQKALVQKVNSLMALCDRLEKEIETQKTTQEDWMQSCLREVFEG